MDIVLPSKNQNWIDNLLNCVKNVGTLVSLKTRFLNHSSNYSHQTLYQLVMGMPKNSI